jgi:hypothetical protein
MYIIHHIHAPQPLKMYARSVCLYIFVNSNIIYSEFHGLLLYVYTLDIVYYTSYNYLIKTEPERRNPL